MRSTVAERAPLSNTATPFPPVGKCVGLQLKQCEFAMKIGFKSGCISPQCKSGVRKIVLQMKGKHAHIQEAFSHNDVKLCHSLE
jgi:hypothetical protein